MRIGMTIFLALLFLQSCTNKFSQEDWEGSTFVSENNSGSYLECSDNARIELLADSVCKVRNLSFVTFYKNVNWPNEFTGKWYLYEIGQNKYLNISFEHRSVSFNVETAAYLGRFNPGSVWLKYYVGDPDDWNFHCLHSIND